MEEILNGDIYIAPLHESDDSIGEMDHECEHCGALKFKNKNTRLCCLDGKVNLPSYPEPPKILNDLWFGDGEKITKRLQSICYLPRTS